MSRDENLLTYATSREAEILATLWEHGSYRAAAASLDLSHGTVSGALRRVRERAARQGYAPGHFDNGVEHLDG